MSNINNLWISNECLHQTKSVTTIDRTRVMSLPCIYVIVNMQSLRLDVNGDARLIKTGRKNKLLNHQINIVLSYHDMLIHVNMQVRP